jgi:hypothetical protein
MKITEKRKMQIAVTSLLVVSAALVVSATVMLPKLRSQKKEIESLLAKN